DDMAVVWCHRRTKRNWTGAAPPPKDIHYGGDEFITRSTMVFRKEAGGWRVVHAHFSEASSGERPGGVWCAVSTSTFAVVPAHSASFWAFTPVFDGLWTRVNALMLGTHNHRPLEYGFPQRGPRDTSVAGCPSRGRLEPRGIRVAELPKLSV